MHGERLFLADLALVLCVAAVTTVVFRRLRQPVVLGYLLAGVIVGPHTDTPLFLFADQANLEVLSELGVILVMFAIGLEFSLRRLVAVLPRAGPVAARRPTIDRLFDGATVEAILAKLDAEAAGAGVDADWAKSVAATVRTKSPTSLKVALAQMQRGAHWDFSECMIAEFRIVSRIVHGRDFYEGVRAAIIDKDNAPRWEPASLDLVTPQDVERHFAPLAGDELELR